MPPHTPPKAQLRARLLATRRALPAAQRATASRSVCERLLNLPEVAGARTVAGFWPTPTEVDIRPALAALLEGGCTLLLPWVEGDDLRLAAVGDPGADLAPGWRGVLEPSLARRSSAVPLERADAVMVPGLGFDREGNRLGYGGGHFDRLLARRAAGTPLIATAFAVQLLDVVPVEEHDVPVDVVVTESGVVRPRRPRAAQIPQAPHG